MATISSANLSDEDDQENTSTPITPDKSNQISLVKRIMEKIPERVKTIMFRVFVTVYILAFIVSFGLLSESPNTAYIINICLSIGAMIGVFAYLLKGVCSVRRETRVGSFSWVSDMRGSIPDISVEVFSKTVDGPSQIRQMTSRKF